ncbi:MAG TPA: hypothetical protein VJY15_03720, partial [Candidatus Acidoferrum sp.]|nr:hypothetical protein [Candidatus Acidoferrum sp.]
PAPREVPKTGGGLSEHLGQMTQSDVRELWNNSAGVTSSAMKPSAQSLVQDEYKRGREGFLCVSALRDVTGVTIGAAGIL